MRVAAQYCCGSEWADAAVGPVRNEPSSPSVAAESLPKLNCIAALALRRMRCDACIGLCRLPRRCPALLLHVPFRILSVKAHSCPQLSPPCRIDC